MALAREEFGAVHAAGFDADEDAAGGGGWDVDGFDLEDFGSAGGAHDGCAHGFGHGAGGGWVVDGGLLFGCSGFGVDRGRRWAIESVGGRLGS